MTRVVNADQVAAWDGSEGEHWAANEARYDDAARAHHRRLLAAVAISDGEHVLDIGCGNGQSTRDAARITTSGSVLGVDLSQRMIDRARQRAHEEGLTNVRFERADAQVHDFEPEVFDVAMSRFGVMFFDDPVAAFANIGRALRPGGRLAFSAWKGIESNEWISAVRGALAAGRPLPEPPPNAPGPLSLADPERVRGLLAEAGFEDVEIAGVEEPMRFGTDASDAFEFLRNTGVAKGLLEGLDHATGESALDELKQVLLAHESGEGVVFGSSCWLVGARRPPAR